MAEKKKTLKEYNEDLTKKLSQNLKLELQRLTNERLVLSKHLENQLSELKKTQSEQSSIVKLRKHYRDENLVFVLGAGVSLDLGIPNWNTLLQKLLLTTIQENEKSSIVLAKLFDEIFSPSPLIAGRYLQDYFDKKEKGEFAFIEAVRKVLYENLNSNNPSELIDEILNFCVSPGKTPNLDCIITYNYDDIIENKLKNLKFGVPYKPIYSIGMNAENGEIPIYHVHGYLPQEDKLSIENSITLGESTYHDQYSDIYSWNNLVQLNKFIEKNCLFIGSSLTDPNIRRLLDIAKKQSAKDDAVHYVIKKRYNLEYVEKRISEILNKDKRVFNEKVKANLSLDETSRFLIDIIEKFEENDLLTLGVNTIWVDTFDEIPNVMRKVRN